MSAVSCQWRPRAATEVAALGGSPRRGAAGSRPAGQQTTCRWNARPGLLPAGEVASRSSTITSLGFVVAAEAVAPDATPRVKSLDAPTGLAVYEHRLTSLPNVTR